MAQIPTPPLHIYVVCLPYTYMAGGGCMSMFELQLKTHLDHDDTSVDQWMLSHLCLGVHNPEVTVLYHVINKTEGVDSVYSGISFEK